MTENLCSCQEDQCLEKLGFVCRNKTTLAQMRANGECLTSPVFEGIGKTGVHAIPVRVLPWPERQTS